MDEKLKSSSTKGQITHKRKVRNPPPQKKLSSLVSPGQMITFSLLVSKVDYATVSTLITRGKRGQCCYGRRSPVGVSTAGVSGLNSSLPPSFSISLSHTHTCSHVPPSISASFTLTLPPTRFFYLPTRPQIQLQSGCRGRQTQVQLKGILVHNMLGNCIMGVTSLQAELQCWPNAQPSALFYVLITHQVLQKITREKEGQHMCCTNF